MLGARARWARRCGNPDVTPYSAAGEQEAPADAVVRARFSSPIAALDSRTFTLRDSRGRTVAAAVDQIDERTWGSFLTR